MMAGRCSRESSAGRTTPFETAAPSVARWRNEPRERHPVHNSRHNSSGYTSCETSEKTGWLREAPTSRTTKRQELTVARVHMLCQEPACWERGCERSFIPAPGATTIHIAEREAPEITRRPVPAKSRSRKKSGY